MKDLRTLDRYRVSATDLWGWDGDETCGAFNVPSPIDRQVLLVIASQGMGWDHVSVSRRNRTPNWYEMEHVKRLCFHDDEVCMQLHVAVAEHVSLHPHCLHMWRPNDGREIPLPDSITVAPKVERA